jgi:hypothetical protein
MDEECSLHITQVAHFLHRIPVNKACEELPHTHRTLPESFAGDAPIYIPKIKRSKALAVALKDGSGGALLLLVGL